MRTIEQAAQECAERIDSKVRMFTAHTGALEDFTPLIAAAMRDVLTQSEKASAFVNVAVRASIAETALDMAEGALKDILSTNWVSTVDEAMRGGNTPACAAEAMHTMAGQALIRITEVRK